MRISSSRLPPAVTTLAPFPESSRPPTSRHAEVLHRPRVRRLRTPYLPRVYTECMLGGMSVPLTLLGLLEREPSHGYDLKRDYDAYFGRDKPVPYGQVYATLSRLARDGMAIVGPPESGEGPERKRYTITEDGVTEV